MLPQPYFQTQQCKPYLVCLYQIIKTPRKRKKSKYPKFRSISDYVYTYKNT